MDQQVRRIAARYGINLSDDETERIAREAEAQEKVLEALYRVELDHIRPILGMAHVPPKREKKPRARRTSGRYR